MHAASGHGKLPIGAVVGVNGSTAREGQMGAKTESKGRDLGARGVTFSRDRHHCMTANFDVTYLAMQRLR